MLLLIDNYDSFTYNLYQYFCELGTEVVVKRNDEIQLADIENLSPTHLVISPALVPPTRLEFLSQLFVILPVSYPYWECVWAIRLWGRRLVRVLCGRGK